VSTTPNNVYIRTQMATQLGFLLKLLGLSALLSVAIKYVGPSLFIPGTATNALIMVLSPTVILMTILLWRIWEQQQQN
jgi:hypothetical protein